MPTPLYQGLSRTAYAGDGVTTTWNFNFTGGYLDPAHVKAYTQDASDNIVYLGTVPLVGSAQVTIIPAVPVGTTVFIYRETPNDAPIVDFADGSGLSEVALDTNAKQAVFLAAEAADFKSFIYTPISALTAPGGASLIGYRAPGLDSATRSVFSRLSDRYSVKDAGAQGGGADDTAAFKRAVASGNKAIGVPPGVWEITDLQIPAGVVLVGAGIDVTTIKRRGTNFSSAFISSISAASVGLAQMTIDGNKAAGFVGVPYDVYFLACSRTRMWDVRVVNSSGRGVSFDNNTDAASGSYSVFDGVDVTAANEAGMVVQESSNILVTRSGWSNNGTYGFLYVSNGAGYTGDNISVTGSLAVNNGASGIFFPLVGTAATPACRNVVVVGNGASDNNENGIAVQSQYGAVSGNVCFRNGTTMSHQGILINGQDITVTGNTSSDNAGVGIDLGDCVRTTCTANTVSNNGILGIEVNSCEGTTVVGNIVTNNNTTPGAAGIAAGILVHKGTGGYPFVGDAVDTIIANNVVRSGPHQEFGILVTADTVDTVLSGNICKGSGTIDDIRVMASTYSSSQNVTSAVRPGAATFVASASTLVLPDIGDWFTVTGAATVTTITQKGGGFPQGRTVRLRFNGAGITLAHAVGNIYLKNSTSVISTSNTQTIDLMGVDGSGWLEVSRNF